jgi:hypothetical protein
MHTTTAPAGGSKYRPHRSATLACNSGSVENLNVSTRQGLRSCSAHPRIVRQTDRETGTQWDSFADWPVERLDDNVASAFARLLALPHNVWLRWRDDMSNDIECLQEGAVKVGFGSSMSGAKPSSEAGPWWILCSRRGLRSLTIVTGYSSGVK